VANSKSYVVMEEIKETLALSVNNVAVSAV
jgi:hypothetical protein